MIVTCASKQMSRAVRAESCADSRGIFKENVLDCASQRVPFGSVPSALSKLGRFCTISRKFIYLLLTKTGSVELDKMWENFDNFRQHIFTYKRFA